MRVLVVGGSGRVGTIVLPYLAQQHTLRVFDLRPPASADWEYIAGNVVEAETLAPAMRDIDALLYMAMGGLDYDQTPGITSNFDANVKGVYLALYEAHKAGINHAVYTSSMSVYGGDLMTRPFPDEGITPDATDVYGLTKYFGEQVCRNATRAWGMSVNALRLCYPTADEQWQAETRRGTPTLKTAASDVAAALHAALDFRGVGFEPFMISGDYEQRLLKMAKAKRVLGWEPRARPHQ